MPLLQKKPREEPEIPSSSLADIAFLLLIFFLVTTTINADKGIYMQLPPKLDVNNPPPEINQRNLLNILVAADGQVLVDNEVTSISQIRPIIIRHITNNGREPQFSVSPDKAVTSFKTKRGLPYSSYIDVLDEIKGAYNDVRNQAARQEFGVDYGVYKARLEDGAEDVIAEKYPLKISLAEPDPG